MVDLDNLDQSQDILNQFCKLEDKGSDKQNESQIQDSISMISRDYFDSNNMIDYNNLYSASFHDDFDITSLVNLSYQNNDFS